MEQVKVSARGRRRVLGGHPWVYRDDVSEVGAGGGSLVEVRAPRGDVLGWALYSGSSKIALRFVTRSSVQPDREFWRRRVKRAVAARVGAGLVQVAGGERLIAGDADGIPGLVVDRYRDRLVVQSGTQASDKMRDFLLEILTEELAQREVLIAGILDRSDAGVRRHEELEPRVEWLRGGPELSELWVEEQGLEYAVDILGGHKTGHYLDQRDNRVRAAELVVEWQRHGFAQRPARVLDVFSYDGLFGLRAALAGAGEVLCLDQAAAAGERVLLNAERNGLEGRVAFEKVDAMGDLARRVREGEVWDLVVLDPPAFARSRREVTGAKRGYGELFRRGFQLLSEGGFLVAATCSFNLRLEDFHEVLTKAARDAGVEVTLVELTGAAPDHPRRIDLPETDYLKCAFLRVEAR